MTVELIDFIGYSYALQKIIRICVCCCEILAQFLRSSCNLKMRRLVYVLQWRWTHRFDWRLVCIESAQKSYWEFAFVIAKSWRNFSVQFRFSFHDIDSLRSGVPFWLWHRLRRVSLKEDYWLKISNLLLLLIGPKLVQFRESASVGNNFSWCLQVLFKTDTSEPWFEDASSLTGIPS